MGLVEKVVARNFDEVVWDSTKDVFLMMHAPWCGHCRQLRPAWYRLAERFSEDSNIKIVWYNAEANREPIEFKVNGYPSLYWVPKTAKKGKRGDKMLEFYKGKRDLESFVDFVKESATVQPANVLPVDTFPYEHDEDEQEKFLTPEEIKEDEEKLEAEKKEFYRVVFLKYRFLGEMVVWGSI